MLCVLSSVSIKRFILLVIIQLVQPTVDMLIAWLHSINFSSKVSLSL